ncbi:hypothetical protein COCOBI_16-0490 [Coccomyxa sp. Obi]|nr:hypothetical protein COCOBI_16-0490 [Coccomyxa sp. Obi]
MLANKFGMDSIMRDVDDFLADKVAPNGSSSALWGGDVDKAVHWLSVAGKNNLMRLSAKAERFLVQAATRNRQPYSRAHPPVLAPAHAGQPPFSHLLLGGVQSFRAMIWFMAAVE